MLRLAFLSLVTAACASSSSSAAPEPATAIAAPALAAERARPKDSEWGTIRIVSRGLEVEVPEVADWQYRAGKSWVRLEHAPSDSTLELWLARAERGVRPSDCEARARLERPELFRPAPETTIETRVLDAPAGFRSELTVGIYPKPGATALDGYVVAFGAAVGRCFAAQFVTRVEGRTGAELELARRLDLIASRTLPGITLRGVEDRVGSPERR
jgi:hypothetical protein